MKLQILICGVGGQGVLFLTRVLGEAALLMNVPFISSETHGMAVRGGSVVSHIKIGNFNSPLIKSGQADILFVLSESEIAAYGHYLKNKGSAFINSTKTDNQSHCDVTDLALRAGSIKTLNLCLLGYALSREGFPFTYRTICEAVQKITPKNSLSINSRALELGYRFTCSSHTI